MVNSVEEGSWPSCPEEAIAPGRFTPLAQCRGALDPVRWSDLARLYTPITAAPLQPIRPAILADPEPESGARWGRPSTFSWSSQAAKTSPAQQSISNQTPSGAPVEYMRIIPAQAQVASQKVKVRSPGDEDVWIEIDRLTRMMFRYAEFPPKSSPSGMTPTLTTYFDLTFDLHPPASEEA